MARPPVLSGELAERGAIELLRELEHRRVTGTLRFEGARASGQIVLYGGEIAVEQPPREDGLDPVDVLLDLGPGRYEVHQRLPPLAVSKGDDFVRTGSLAVHVPADLMNYCEHAGLTGVLELRHEGRRAEALYEAGELLAIQLDGEGTDDLTEIFGWEQGRFRIEIDPAAPERARDEAPTTELPVVPREGKPKREDTRQFLRVLELALVDVIDKSERARSPTRTSPPLPPPPAARPRPASLPPPRGRRPDAQTVRLIYLSGDPPASTEADKSTRHVTRGDAEAVFTEARPERRAADPEPDEMAKTKKKKKQPVEAAPPPEEPRASAEEAEAEDAEAGEQARAPEAAAQDATEEAAAEEAAAEEAAAEAAPAARGSSPAPAPAPAGGTLGAVAWAFGVLLLGLLILAVLARLPPIE